MISAKKRAAVQANGRRSKGPKTPAGRRRARHNALRHGLSLVNRHNPVYAHEIEQMANAICSDSNNAALFEQALIIAECALLLRLIGEEKSSLIEHYRNPFASTAGRGRTLVQKLKLRSQKRAEAYEEYAYLQNRLNASGEINFTWLAPKTFKPGEVPARYEPLRDRNDNEALEAAMPDFQRLLRYERRALSRQKRAVELYFAIAATSVLIGTQP